MVWACFSSFATTGIFKVRMGETPIGAHHHVTVYWMFDWLRDAISDREISWKM
jgi:hypothetical protein